MDLMDEQWKIASQEPIGVSPRAIKFGIMTEGALISLVLLDI